MAKFYYYMNNQRIGPIEKEVLQQLSASGSLPGSAIIEADTGHRSEAAQVPWLTFPAREPVKYDQEKYIISYMSPDTESIKKMDSIGSKLINSRKALIYFGLSLFCYFDTLIIIHFSNGSDSFIPVLLILFTGISCFVFFACSYFHAIKGLCKMLISKGIENADLYCGIILFLMETALVFYLFVSLVMRRSNGMF